MPTRLEYEDVVATAINRGDLADDVRGINASLDLIKRTRGGNWPMGTRTPLSDEVIGYDVDVSWWVTPHAHAVGYYAMAYAGLRHWFVTELAF